MSTPAPPPTAFALDRRLDADTLPVGDLALSSVHLMDDARFPWLILVPRRPGLVEITDLDEADAQALMAEIRVASRVLLEVARPDKVNVGALGNIVSQLHVHVLARFASDPAWPGPAWGHGARIPYPPHAAPALLERLRAAFAAA
ncbi:HIT domain-containing protein [Salinarimonas rosea]|uniref:HIT domain-containing protein n=1 Tax=Salinarimonas rosea TaxID=552063 RepID=UPI00040CD550|nr:HIT family protein [Salinarimonas rosea]